ncbi:MAG: NAD(P)-binding protein, partial [Gammaproteobacteria bacterium]|nr:NAD(P)-binding protein [Gammaproteobacteria bacterium]
MTISRRQLILGGVAVTAGSLLGPRRAAAAGEEVDTIVIGSGLAGLYAAMVLGDGGASALVLEGAGKVGGRCQTAYDWDPRIELGGVQIGQMYARVRYIAGRLGIELGEGAHINAPYSFVLDKQLIAAGKWESSPLNKLSSAERKIPPHALRSHYVEAMNPFEALDDWLKPSAAQYDVTLAQWLDQKGASPVAKQLIRATQGGEDSTKLGLL